MYRVAPAAPHFRNRSFFGSRSIRTALVLLGLVTAGSAQAQTSPAFDLATQHYDSLRTGWNPNEQTLTPANVESGDFGLLRTVALDNQVHAQPLFVTSQTITGKPGKHNVVYVATEGNTVYAIDTASGGVLRKQNLGAPVPKTLLPGGCPSSGGVLGILSTPVIDRASNTMYLIAYTYENSTQVYRLHALDLSSLADKVPSVVVSASIPLGDGSTYTFRADSSRQRASLLEANGNIYAGFASFCDLNQDTSRGLVLGWKTNTLEPLAAAALTNKRATSPRGCSSLSRTAGPCFMSSIWMSGSGIAADASGNLFFITGNSALNTWDGATNLAESVVKLSGDMTRVVDFFTPASSATGVQQLDRADLDFSAGGILLLPDQPGPLPHLAVAAGKVGVMYLLNRDNMGGRATNGIDKVVGQYNIGACWCSESYFVGADGVGRVVSSGGTKIMVWKIRTSSDTALVQESVSAELASGQDHGFFTSVSSNGTQAGTAIIWAVGHPVSAASPKLTLYAFNAADGSTLFSAPAGNWPTVGGNANTVPVVANGKVYVAGYKQLSIFGPGAAGTGATVAMAAKAVVADETPSPGNEVYGNIRNVDGTRVTLQTRTGTLVLVDAAAAIEARHSIGLLDGIAVRVQGIYDGAGVLQAQSITRAKDSPALWPADH